MVRWSHSFRIGVKGSRCGGGSRGLRRGGCGLLVLPGGGEQFRWMLGLAGWWSMLPSWVIGCLVVWLVGLLVRCSVGRSVGCSVGGWLSGWLVVCLVVWLVGWFGLRVIASTLIGGESGPDWLVGGGFGLDFKAGGFGIGVGIGYRA